MPELPFPKLAACLLACAAFVSAPLCASDSDATLLVEPETFVALGSWQKTGIHIQSSNMPGTAFAGVNITRPGVYQIWTRTQDFPASQPGTRRCLIKLDGRPAARESGQHGKDGWYWEHVGEARLEAGVRLLEIEDSARFYARLDAVLLTAGGLDPNSVGRDALNKYRVDVVQPRRVAPGGEMKPAAPDREAPPLAALDAPGATLVFRAARAEDGSARVWREVAHKTAGGPAVTVEAGVEPLIVIGSAENTASFEGYFPGWKGNAVAEWRLGGRVLSRPADPRDPFVAGEQARLEPVAARRIKTVGGADAVEVEYREILPAGAASGRAPKTARALWHAPTEGFATRVEVEHETEADGWYSFAFASGAAVPRDEVAAVQLPPLFQFRRVPDAAEMITSSLTSHPFALVERRAKGDAAGVTFGVVAAPEFLSREWPTKHNARCGFALVAPSGDAQGWIFAPILGGDNSHAKRGEKVRATWWAVAAPQSWAEVMRAADTKIFGLADYREPVAASLTEQALNIIDLMADDEASGWDARLKGPANIESPNTVTHAAPLAYFTAARLTRDEAFFDRRALPALEYLLSRPSAHFALSAEGNLYVTKRTARIDFKNIFFGSAVWQGADDLTGGLNPWLLDYMRTAEGRPLKPANNSAETDWSGWLALLRQKPDAALLKRVQANVDGWIKRAFEDNPALGKTAGIQPFYNVTFYPYWWDLLDLWQLTGEPRYLDAARSGAWQTVAGQWVTPTPGKGTLTLYPENKYTSLHHVWWRGDKTWRMGWPEGIKPHVRARVSFAIPEKTVPDWVVSPSGLGVEQPITYFSASDKMSNIQLAVWAPSLLRLYGGTGDDYWRVFARNAIIGRGANYPGYYLSDYIDVMQRPDYPRAGPDLTSFYWHHVPVHLAMLLDYLVTDADVRTKGAVRFPYARQQGYVWFTSRVYGGRAGRVFDDEDCRLWLDRTKFRVDTPLVDYFGARGKNQFHLVLLNQSRGEVTAGIELDTAVLGIAPGARPDLRTACDPEKKTKLVLKKDGRRLVTLPPGGLAVLTFDAAEETVTPVIPKLETRPVSADLGKTWGEMRAFRIRSPFGNDAVYVVLDGRPGSGATARLEIEGGDDAPAGGGPRADAFPYEFSIPRVDMTRDIRLRLHLAESGQPETATPWFELPGTKEKAEGLKN
ncbi:hypothetical protein OH491_02930 [Termitidicoccus mucosus]